MTWTIGHIIYFYLSSTSYDFTFEICSRFNDILVDIYNVNWPKSTVGFNNNHVC